MKLADRRNFREYPGVRSRTGCGGASRSKALLGGRDTTEREGGEKASQKGNEPSNRFRGLATPVT